MRIAERLVMCLAVFTACVLPARAQEAPAREQALPLSQVLKVARDSPDLLRQIDVELRRHDIKAGDVGCVAAQLGGGRGAYQCQFGDRTLRIEADRTYFDVRGKRLGRPGQAPDETVLDKAKSFRENNVHWSWAPEYPR